MIKVRGQALLLPVSPWFIVWSLVFALLLSMWLGLSHQLWLPDVLAIFVFFWGIHQPRRVGMGIAFFLGLWVDVQQSALLGQHALAYTFLSYGAFTIHRRLLWFALPQQALLRAKELKPILDIAKVSHALCEAGLSVEMRLAALEAAHLRQLRHFNYSGPDSLEAAMERQSTVFETVNTATDDTCLIAFTSGTTGIPKATMHFHRDVMAICACWPGSVLKPTPDDVFIGSPPLAFTFGLGGLLLFPMSVGASTVLLDKAGPTQLLTLIDAVYAWVAAPAATRPESGRV
jgi:acyl-CoA synthetase (AMP-forming)/AMP-acid ligase II